MRLLITGGSGLLALNWACALRDELDVVLGTHRHRVELARVRSQPLDLESPERLAGQLREIAPDVVVHTVAMTSVDECDKKPDAARHVNAILAQHVAATTSKLGIKLIHISTDHLFSGERAMAIETDAPAPLNAYARTKLEAEMLVQQEHPAALVVRTNFFGWGSAQRRSFSDWIVDSLRAGRRITMFEDAFYTPILADTLATAAHALAARDARGVYHVVGEERLSKLDFGLRLAQRFDLPADLIARGRMAAAPQAAPRPRDMSLANAKTRTALGRALGSADDFIDALHRQERQDRARELINAVTGT